MSCHVKRWSQRLALSLLFAVTLFTLILRAPFPPRPAVAELDLSGDWSVLLYGKSGDLSAGCLASLGQVDTSLSMHLDCRAPIGQARATFDLEGTIDTVTGAFDVRQVASSGGHLFTAQLVGTASPSTMSGDWEICAPGPTCNNGAFSGTRSAVGGPSLDPEVGDRPLKTAGSSSLNIGVLAGIAAAAMAGALVLGGAAWYAWRRRAGR